MESFAVGIPAALWLGILTSISPCPLATNIAAMSFISRGVAHPGRALISGLIYAMGRTLAYLALGIIIVASLLSISSLSLALQKYLNKLLGPILILAGMMLLDLIGFHAKGGGATEKMQTRIAGWGLWGALPLGFVFALSFCPVSAALFFGSLIPLALRNSMGIALPIVYGLGTALPVVAFAILITTSARSLGLAFDRLRQFERWGRRITGAIFIAVGIYYSLIYVFKLELL